MSAEYLSNSERGVQHQFLSQSFEFARCAVLTQPLEVGREGGEKTDRIG